jgi:hypothetical protein
MPASLPSGPSGCRPDHCAAGVTGFVGVARVGLTNLIAVQRVDASVGDFLWQLALPSAIAIGGEVHLRSQPPANLVAPDHVPADRAGLRLGVPVVIWLLVGFTFGDQCRPSRGWCRFSRQVLPRRRDVAAR